MLCAAAAACTLLAWFGTRGALDWQPGLAPSQPWRWWTAALVHWSPSHLAGNLAGLALLALLGQQARIPGAMAAAWLAAWPFTHLALLLQPGLMHYGGLSGVLHAGVAVVGCWLAATPEARSRWVGLALLLGLAVKVLLEQPWGDTLHQVGGWNIAVAPLAHAAGALSGLLCALLALARGPSPATKSGAT